MTVCNGGGVRFFHHLPQHNLPDAQLFVACLASTSIPNNSESFRVGRCLCFLSTYRHTIPDLKTAKCDHFLQLPSEKHSSIYVMNESLHTELKKDLNVILVRHLMLSCTILIFQQVIYKYLPVKILKTLLLSPILA